MCRTFGGTLSTPSVLSITVQKFIGTACQEVQKHCLRGKELAIFTAIIMTVSKNQQLKSKALCRVVANTKQSASVSSFSAFPPSMLFKRRTGRASHPQSQKLPFLFPFERVRYSFEALGSSLRMVFIQVRATQWLPWTDFASKLDDTPEETIHHC